MSLGFSLSKWTMDVVSDEGEAVVVYAAELNFAALHLHYASVVHSRGLRVHATASLRKATRTHEDGVLTFKSRALETQGTWRADDAATPTEGAPETMLDEDGGRVEWTCHMPLARAEVTLEGGRVVRGLGYVEELHMTVAPWSLPIEELRWGRFTAAGSSLVWLDWRGARAKTVVLKNGARVTGTVENAAVDLGEDEARLQIEEGRALREGTLGGNALAALAELYPVLPPKILRATERMSVAPAVLEQPFMTPVKGWAISQIVTWP